MVGEYALEARYLTADHAKDEPIHVDMRALRIDRGAVDDNWPAGSEAR